MMNVLKTLGLILLTAIFASQFIRPERNRSGNAASDISQSVQTPDDIRSMLNAACYDCHSNSTRYPWYANVQPVAWLISHDVEEGKEHLNFSEFGAGRLRRQFHNLEEIEEQLAADEMPPIAYRWLHPEAKLTAAQTARIIEWSNAAREEMKSRYPADSLLRPRK